MAVSEQEVKNQIAEMRAALDEIHASARIGSVVRILGVLVGLAIVFCLLYTSYYRRIKPLLKPEAWRPVVEKRVSNIKSQMQLEKNLPTLMREVGEAYLTEGRKLVESLDLPKVASSEFETLLKELQPVIMEQFNRILPQMQTLLASEGEKALTDAQELLDHKVSERLAGMLAQQQGKLQTDLGLTEKTVEEMVKNVRGAGEAAAEALIAKRIERNRAQIDRILDLMSSIPPLPMKLTQAELIEELGRALIGRIKYALPEYELQ
jgi:DNA uptake protein ComE-like DNA-binding protein